MAWTLQSQPTGSHELEVYKYLKKQTGNAQLAHNVAQFMDLRKYLDTHNFESASDLRKNVLSDGQPLFSKSESETLFEMTRKRGGGSDSALRSLVDFFYGWMPYGLTVLAEDVVTPNMFILHVLENDPEAGPLYSTALDAVTAALPAIGTAAHDIASNVIGAIPIPESGPVGGLIGWMVGSVFMFLTMLVHMSRRHWAEVFILSTALVPFAGESLYQAAQSAEKFVKKTAQRRADLVETSGRLYGSEVAGIVSDVIPDLNNPPVDTFSPPPETVQFANDIKNSIPSGSPAELIANGQKQLELQGIPTSIDSAKQKLTEQIGNLGLPTSLDSAKQLAANKANDTIRSVTGGKPLSSRLRSKDKWRTQRQLRR
jgi:hypothetical protein